MSALGFPTNTVVVILMMMFATASGAWFMLSHGLRRTDAAPHIKRRWRWGAAFVLTIWLLGPLLFALNPPGGATLTPPLLAAFITLGMLVGLPPLLFSSTFRQILHAIPETWLVGLHATRLGGFAFLALMDMRLLPAEFALPAGYGDMAVGLLALGVVYLLANRKPGARAFTVAWNGLGLLDFVVALTTGILFIGPHAAQLAASGVSLRYLNFVFIVPSFGVPLYTLVHIYSLFQMFSPHADATPSRIGESAHAPVFS